jgi:tRNA-dihydrouridine synthase
MSLIIHAAPLQGFTDFRFRTAFHSCFGGIDTWTAPYIRLAGKSEIKPATARDLLPENNQGFSLIPQVMTREADEFLWVAEYVRSLGYQELNWNLGCPYPMVTKRGLGSGMLNDPAAIDSLLQRVVAESDIQVSIKMRLGYTHSDEILKVLPVLEKYPIKEITLHPRIGKQLYKGPVDLEAFERCTGLTSHPLCYNGDITSVEAFSALKTRFPSIDRWMIGRGMIADPFLPEMIRQGTTQYPDDRIERFSQFHDRLFQQYEEALSGHTHLLIKMFHFWEYFITAFTHSPKGLKKIKKAKKPDAYHEAVREILREEEGKVKG